ncbi:MAG: hypothetical protein IPJ34_24525 [Myxococcales bacterium]|nr:hypothetical protein [Myxococcales bacterium]
MASEKASLGPNAKRGLRVSQVLFFSLLIWVIVAGSWQILRDAVFRGAPPRDALACKTELSRLRARLAEAAMATDDSASDTAAVDAFRTVLGGPSGRAFDQRVYELIDGCPPEESRAAYALARLRAAQEAMLRLDALEAAPARAAHRKAVAPTIGPALTSPPPPNPAPSAPTPAP